MCKSIVKIIVGKKNDQSDIIFLYIQVSFGCHLPMHRIQRAQAGLKFHSRATRAQALSERRQLA